MKRHVWWMGKNRYLDQLKNNHRRKLTRAEPCSGPGMRAPSEVRRNRVNGDQCLMIGPLLLNSPGSWLLSFLCYTKSLTKKKNLTSIALPGNFKNQFARNVWKYWCIDDVNVATGFHVWNVYLLAYTTYYSNKYNLDSCFLRVLCSCLLYCLFNFEELFYTFCA